MNKDSSNGVLMPYLSIERYRIAPDGFCPLCGNTLYTNSDVWPDGCAVCGQPARVRSLALAIDILRENGTLPLTDEPLLSFSITSTERALLETICTRLTSVSLYGEYGSKHKSGVDARNLNDFPNDSFAGYFSCLLYDYFAEHKIALAEAFRVLKPGGIFLAHIAQYRLGHSSSAPSITAGINHNTSKSWSYIPDGKTLPSIKVGLDWFVDAMHDAGFATRILQFSDPLLNDPLTWFVGMKADQTESLTLGTQPAAIVKINIPAFTPIRRTMISIDVGIPSEYATRNHHGITGNSSFDDIDSVLHRMMEIAEGKGVCLSFFLDYSIPERYGLELKELGEEFLRRGHDIQILSTFSRSFPKCTGHPEHNYSFSQADAVGVIHQALEHHFSIAGASAPVAFRSSDLPVASMLHKVLADHGFVFTSGCAQIDDKEPSTAWSHYDLDTDMWDIPIFTPMNKTQSDYRSKGDSPLSGKISDVTEFVSQFSQDLDAFHTHKGDDAVAIIALSPWDLLREDNQKAISGPETNKLIVFERLIQAISKKSAIVKASEVAAKLLRSKRSHSASPDLEFIKTARCPVCDTILNDEHLLEFNNRKGQCAQCRSLERTRAFALLFKSKLIPRLNPAGKRVLLIAPDNVEFEYFRNALPASLETIDIREQNKPTIVGDICNIKDIDSESFDIIESSHVLCFVDDFDAAIAEIFRVLKPGGIYMCYEHLSQGLTRISKNTQSDYYAKDAYAKYQIGNFREFGENDFPSMLGQIFASVQEYRRIDATTGMEIPWFVCSKK